MPPQAIKFTFKSAEMDAALTRLYYVSDKTAAELVNDKGQAIFRKCVWGMKVVEAATIKEELEASAATELVLVGKRGVGKGLRYSRAKKNIKMFFGDSSGKGFPLLAAIIQSRAGKPGSGKLSPWYGVSRAEGAKRMLDAMRKVYGARQKSRGYFKACFATIRDVFRSASTRQLPFSDPASRGSGTVASLARDRGRIADATPATGRSGLAIAKFWLVSPRHDLKDAMREHAEPVLQAAFDSEAGHTWERAIEEEYKEAAKLVGFRVS